MLTRLLRRPSMVGGEVSRVLLRRLTIAARVLFFIGIYFFWPFLKKFFSPAFLFAVYGTDSDKRSYWPAWVEKRLRSEFPIGILRFKGRWGLIGATSTTREEMRCDPQAVRALLRSVEAEFPGVGVVALAGQLPSFVHRAGGKFDTPFVSGAFGTRYAMVSAAHEGARKLGRLPGDCTIAVVGAAGFTGRGVVADLAPEFGRVIALDPRYATGLVPTGGCSNVCYTSFPAPIATADLVLVLTGTGDESITVVPHLRADTLVIDDTHPPIHAPIRRQMEERGATVVKAVMRDGRLRMFPRLPNFRGGDIPGCLLEALVVLCRGREVLESPQRFFEAAGELGFRAELLPHLKDS